jgi:putative lipoprotein
VPIPFEIAYDPARIDPRTTCAAQARIEEDGRLRFITYTRYPALTRNAATHVDMMLKSVGSAPR